MKIQAYLGGVCIQNGLGAQELRLPDIEVAVQDIRVLMISECPAPDACDDFYSLNPDGAYAHSTRMLFAGADWEIASMQALLDDGIYVTTAVKTPKSGYAVDAQVLRSHLPLLEAELAAFSNLRAVMLMGDVAIKGFNLIYRKEHKKNLIPAQSTCRIRGNTYLWGDVRVFPFYIMTGKNLLIEKSKPEMIAQDIRAMRALL